MNSNIASADNQQSSIRAWLGRDQTLCLTSTTMPCAHCSNEKRTRRIRNDRFQKRCYYSRGPGHLMASCNLKQHDEATQLIKQAMNARTRIQSPTSDFSEEYIVMGTDNELWSDIWYVNSAFKHHYAGSLSVFKRIKNSLGVETRTGENDFLFIRGLGMVNLKTEDRVLSISSVYYTPELNRNVLSLDQLILQGFVVKMEGVKCQVTLMFDDSSNQGMKDVSELGNIEKEDIMMNHEEHEAYKNDYLNTYFKNLSKTCNESECYSFQIQSFDDCVSFIQVLDDMELVFKYKDELQVNFEKMIGWFLHDYLGMKPESRPIPAFSEKDEKIHLLDLYLMVMTNGGHKRVTIENLWAVIAKDLGFDYEDCFMMRIAYAQYLDVFEYNMMHYKMAESRLTEGGAKGNSKDDCPKGSNIIEGDAHDKDAKEMTNYALFMGCDWHGAKRLARRKTFDFRPITKIVEEAHNSKPKMPFEA